MADPKIEVQITGDASKLKKAAGEAEQAIGGLSDKAGKAAKDKLGPLGDIADKVGVDLGSMSSGALVAGAGIAGLAAGVAKGVSEFQHQAEEVRKFKDAVGTSWDASSRLVAISDDLGISAESVGGAMKKLATNIGNNAGLLDEYGISTVKAKDGTVDMVGTLGNVADAFNSTTDATQRNAMAQKLFGKSWSDLAPLLQQGGRGIRDAAAGVKDYQIVSAESAEDSRKLSMAMDDMQDAVRGLEIAMAKGLIPMLTEGAKGAAGFLDKVNQVGSALSKAANKDSFWWGTGEQHKVQQLNDEMKRSPTFINDVGKSMGIAGAEAVGLDSKMLTLKLTQEQNAKAAALVAAHTKDLAAEARNAADALKDERQRLEEANNTLMTVVGTQLAYESSTANLEKSLAGVTEAHKAMDDAVNTYGGDSAEAKKATDDYNSSVRDAKGAAEDTAQAAANLAEKTAIAAGETFTAEQKSIVYRDALNKVRDAANDPLLASGLDGMVGLVDAASRSAGNGATQFYALANAAAAAASAAAAAAGINTSAVSADSAERQLTPQAARASGGPTMAGVSYLVGEHGPEVVNFGQPGYVTPAGGGGSPTYVVNVYGAVGNEDDLMRFIHAGLVKLERSKR